MKFCSFLICLTYAAHLAIVRCENPEPTENFPHYAVLDQDDKVWLYWKFNETYITFEFHGNTNGWVGIGISPNGGMRGADLYVGWVKDGQAYITDRHAFSNTFPSLDPEQNVELLEGRECDGWTIIKFQRQLVGCEDSYDITIGTSTIKMIWALGRNDPTGDDITRENYHGNGNEDRGVKTLLILEAGGDCKPDEVTNSTEFLSGGVFVPSRRTYYSCELFKLPDLSVKNQIIKVEPVIQPGNEAYVHHILLYQCKFDKPRDVNLVGNKAECYRENMPQDYFECNLIVLGWAIGGGTFCFPEHVGYPTGPKEPKYFMMETHYDNPDARADIVDNSGLRIFYTEELRQYDAGTLQIGLPVYPFNLLIPKKTQSFNIYAECTSECLTDGMESGGISEINIFGTLLHSHLLGRQLTLRHLTEMDSVELSPVAVDLAYDFNYQETKLLRPEVVVRRGDTLQIKCNYNSEGRDEYTLGGEGTDQEMCQAFVSYYPRIPVQRCMTSPVFIWNYFGIPFTYLPYYPGVGLKDALVPNTSYTLHDVVEYVDWTTERANDFSSYVQHQHRFRICVGTDSLKLKNVDRYDLAPNVTSPHMPPDQTCAEPAGGKTTVQAQTDCSSSANPMQQSLLVVACIAGLIALFVM